MLSRTTLMSALNAAVLLVALVVGLLTLRRLLADPVVPPRSDLSAISSRYGTTPRPLEGIDVFADTAVTLGGRQARPTVLYHFATTCGACGLNAPAWDSLAKSVSHWANPVLISWEPKTTLQSHFSVPPSNFAVISLDESQRDWAREEYSLYATPITYLYDVNGALRVHHVGVFQGGDSEKFLSAFPTAEVR